MESIRWRYRTEFIVRVTIDGQPAGNVLRLIPLNLSSTAVQNYGLITNADNGSIVCSVKQHHNGVNWVVAVPLTTPQVFAFGFILSNDPGSPDLDFFSQGNGTFGRRIFYANNLSANGAIDSNLAGNSVLLTPGADVALSDAGSLSSGILSRQFSPGTFTQFRAGKIHAGAPVSFLINQAISATADRASIDMTLHPNGSYVISLDGGAPVEERVMIDPVLASSDVQGVVEIFRDVFLVPAQPRQYTINFTT